jgi:hypothetical protein
VHTDPTVPVAPDLTSAATTTSPKLQSQQLAFYPYPDHKCQREPWTGWSVDKTSNTTVKTLSTDWSPTDFVYAAAWIKTPTLEGILFAGNVTAPGANGWYGNGTILSDTTAGSYSQTSNPPPAFVDPLAPNTRGTHADKYVPRCWIYSAADLASVASGAKLPYQIAPVETFDPAALLALPLGQGGSIVGMCQDPDDAGLLYVNLGSLEKVSPFSSITMVAALRVQ